ncbi:MAG: DUF4214 domain-containing protein [Burkholderiaceae bacterium]|nr:DUF4214 domain-containing protein [Burkholderiaceae bacterium]
MKSYRQYIVVSLLPFIAMLQSGCGGRESPERVVTTSAVKMGATVKKTESDLDPGAPVHLGFSMLLKDKDGLEQYILDMYNPDSPNYRKSLTSEDVLDRFGPTEAQIKKLTTYLNKHGFKNINVHSNRLMVEADTTVKLAQSSFSTTLKKYTLPDGRTAQANNRPATLPSDISDVVSGFFGLDTVTRFQAHHVTATPTMTATSPTYPGGSVVSHNLRDYRHIYNVGNTAAAMNMTVGIITWGDPTPSIADLRKYEQYHGLAATPTSIIISGATPSTDTRDTAEWSLDSQAIVAMSSGLKKLKFYTASSANIFHVFQAINKILSDPDKPQVINMSFGICDPSLGDLFDSSYFAVAVALGQTFVASSGDYGSSCPSFDANGNAVLLPNTTSYPASSRFVVNVGGTTLGTMGEGYYVGETAWSGSGGGISKYVPIPFWQTTVASLTGKRYRSGPDVAFVADPDSGAAKIFVNGAMNPYPMGGTSLAAPLFTATWARLLQSCGTNLGFAAPTLYAYANRNPNMFRDITRGSNGAYSAYIGWDSVTGWGSIDIDAMRTALCPGAAYIAATQALYVAYLGRPAEPAGLAYWSNRMKNFNTPISVGAFYNAYGSNLGVTGLVDALANSPESLAFYTTSHIPNFVTQVYKTLFNRSPDPAGLNYWVSRINSGNLSKRLAPLAILQAAFSNATLDSNVAGNKISVARNFTATLTNTQSAYYAGAAAGTSARKLLQNVHADGSNVDGAPYYSQASYVSSYQPSINAAIAAIVAGRPY